MSVVPLNLKQPWPLQFGNAKLEPVDFSRVTITPDTTLWASDIHLGLEQVHQPLRFAATLVSAFKAGIRNFVIVGDLFDQDFRTGQISLEVLKALHAERDVTLTWIEGNHDRALSLQTQQKLLPDITPVSHHELQVGAMRTLAIHGDCFDWFIANFPRFSSSLSWLHHHSQRLLFRHVTKQGQPLFDYFQDFSQHAITHALKNKFDMIIYGHTHHAKLHKDSVSGVVLLDLGCWIKKTACTIGITNHLATHLAECREYYDHHLGARYAVEIVGTIEHREPGQ